MRKILFTLSVGLICATSFAQTEPKSNSEFNKWSLEINGGLSKYQRPATSGFFTETPAPWNADFGVRYMFNNKFGLKLGVGYNNFKGADNSLDFETHLYSANLQAVANLGRIMNFETWTNTIGLLGHAGVGYAQLKSENHDFTDKMGTFIFGITPQVKLTKNIALTGDLSTIVTAKQDYAFDGFSKDNSRGFNGLLFQGTLGLTFYLGGNNKHADWAVMDSQVENELSILQDRLNMIERGLVDSDQDGVADMFDAEPNSIAGVAVDTKGRSIDNNKNGVPDELENYLDSRLGNTTKSTSGLSVQQMINEGYVNVYFDFNATTPTTSSSAGINFITQYLKSNPSASVDVIGYSDAIGNSDYNQNLSLTRAQNVKQILVDAGIQSSRLNVIGNGVDGSVNKNSKDARNIVRRVTFKIK